MQIYCVLILLIHLRQIDFETRPKSKYVQCVERLGSTIFAMVLIVQFSIKKKTLLVCRIHKHYENGDCLTIAPGFVAKPNVSPFNDDAYTSNIDVHLQSYKSKAFADY